MNQESRLTSVHLGDDSGDVHGTSVAPSASTGRTPLRNGEAEAPRSGADSAKVKRSNESGTLERVRGDGDDTGSVVVRKNHRIASKVDQARRLVDTLPQDDRRARLLHAASVRRDEVVLDALLQELGDHDV